MGNLIGIVAEYNPFHAGHAYQIRRAREIAGEESTVIAVMSGDFVQRGSWAIQPKAVRARAACEGGADAVFELPLPWCMASAQRFARAGVGMLVSLGITHLSFGSESGDLSRLSSAAERISAPGFEEEVSALMRMKPNLTYPRARAAVLGDLAVSAPNDMLAVEYLAALKGTSVVPLPVVRVGSGHDEAGESLYPSASELRQRILSGNLSVPHPDGEKMEVACLSRLRMLRREDFLTLPDCADGLGERLYDAVRACSSLEAVYDTAKTRRYTQSRVRRAVLSVVLGIQAGQVEADVPYARLLAMNDAGRRFLSRMRDRISLPVLTLPKQAVKLGEAAEKVFSLGASAHDFYLLSYPDKGDMRCGQDYRQGPILVQN